MAGIDRSQDLLDAWEKRLWGGIDVIVVVVGTGGDSGD